MDQEQMIRRICDQDNVIGALQQKLVQLSADSADLREKISQKQEFDADMLAFSNQMRQNNEFVKNSILDFQRRIDLLDRESSVNRTHIDGHSQRMHHQESKMDNVLDLMKETEDRHARHEKRTSDIEQKNQEFKKLLNDYNSYQAQVYSTQMEIRQAVISHDSKIKEYDGNYKTLSYRLEVWDRENRVANESLKGELKQLRSIQDLWFKAFEEGFSKVNKTIDDKIDAIPKVELPPQVDVNAIVKESFNDMNSKLNDIKMDLENSSLKFSNNEMQTKVFEKKLENLSLLLKKYEITK